MFVNATFTKPYFNYRRFAMETNFFETIEQHAAYRAAWSAAVNDVRAKSTLAKHDEWIYNDVTKRGTVSKDSGQHKVSGWIRPQHHLLFNIIKGRDLSTGFTPITNKNKIVSNHLDADFGINHAKRTLSGICITARNVLANRETPTNAVMARIHERQELFLTEFLQPYAGTITIEMLAKIDDSNFITTNVRGGVNYG
jgi:hypothetical protein